MSKLQDLKNAIISLLEGESKENWSNRIALFNFASGYLWNSRLTYVTVHELITKIGDDYNLPLR